MRWFGRKAAGRDDARPTLARGYSAFAQPWMWGMGEDCPQSYDAQVRDAYLRNPIAQRAVRLVVEGVAATPMTIGGTVDGAPVARLIAARSAGQNLVETIALHLLLHGNAYIQLLADDSGAPGELYALRPDRVTIEVDPHGWPLAYAYRIGEKVLRIPASEGAANLIHLRTAHPLDDHYGLGCMAAAAGAVAIHNAATRWNKALLDNAARPSGAMIYDPGDPGATLTPQQFDRLRTEIDASFAGAANAGRPMLLEGGLKWQSLSLTPADMDFVGLKAGAAREIALAFGVPPMLLGLPGDAAYANYREANRSLWRQTILPLAQVIFTGLADGLRPWFPELALTPDIDRVGALSEEREALWAQVSAADFLNDDEKRALLGLAPRPVEGGVQGNVENDVEAGNEN